MAFLADPMFALFLSLSGGYLIGRISFGPVQLGGVCGTLFVALAIGQVGVSIGDDLRNAAFALFIFSLGFTAGPQFFANVRGGWRFGIFSILEVVTALSLTLLFVAIFRFDVGTAAGLFAGSATESAVVGTASEAIAHLDHIEGDVARLQGNIATAYSLTYLFGMVGIILFASQVAPWLMRVNLGQEAARLEREMGGGEEGSNSFPVFVERAFKVGDLAGRKVRSIEEQFNWTLTIPAIRRGTEIVAAGLDSILAEGDIVYVRGRRNSVIGLGRQLGEEITLPHDFGFEVKTRDAVFANPDLAAQSVAELATIVPAEMRRGIFVTQIHRMGQRLAPLPKTRLQQGDILTLYGPSELVDQAARKLGPELPAQDFTDFVFLGLGIAVGLFIGSLSATVGGIELTLGGGGGALVAGLVFGWINMRRPRLGALPAPAANFAKEFGLAVFIAAIGLKTGPDVIEQLKKYGLILPFIGLVVSVGPALVSLIVGYRLMKIPLPIMLGAVAGQHCSTPTLLAVMERTGNTIPVIGYTVTYAISNVILPLTGPVIVTLAAMVVPG